MQTRRALLVIAVLLSMGACASPDALSRDGRPLGGTAAIGGKADEYGDAPGATLVFGDDWSESVRGTVRAGEPVRVLYDVDRLPSCRGEMGGIPQWAITAQASIDGGAPFFVELGETELEDVVEGAIDAVGGGEELAIWFSVTNRWGCHEHDSDFGANYGFEIEGPDAARAAIVRFEADGTVAVAGEIAAGGVVTVVYEPSRVEACRGTTSGHPAWGVTGFASVDGSEPATFDPTVVDGTDRVARAVRIEVPAGGESLALWFQHTNRWGCVAWDSNDGANYVFEIAR